MLLVGTALYNGDGVAADPVTAYAYVSRAAAQGLGAGQGDTRRPGSTLDAARAAAKGRRAGQIDGDAEGERCAESCRGQARGDKPAPPREDRRRTARRCRRPRPPPRGKWRIQLGAFGQRNTAEALFARLGGKLAGRQAYYIPAGKVVRLQVGPFESRAAAAAACARLARPGLLPGRGR